MQITVLYSVCSNHPSKGDIPDKKCALGTLETLEDEKDMKALFFEATVKLGVGNKQAIIE